MCKFKSGIILKNRVVLTPMFNDSHSSLLERLGIEDTSENAMRIFVRVELTPPDNDRSTDPKTWKYIVDQDIKPDWYETDSKRYENEFREKVENWVKDETVIMAGKSWLLIKKDESGTYFLLNGTLEKLKFGESNNYTESFIRTKLNEGDLAKELKEEFGDRIVPIRTNLMSLDGLKDYGTTDGDTLAIPNLDLYRECREKISSVDDWWWLPTPNSTPSGYGTRCVQCVGSDGGVGYDVYGCSGGVRPFCILKS